MSQMEIDPECWSGFIAMRRAKGQRAPWTPRAEKLLLNKLAAYHQAGWDVNHMLDEACERGWSSVFEFQGCRRVKQGMPLFANEELKRQAQQVLAKPEEVARAMQKLNSSIRRVS